MEELYTTAPYGALVGESFTNFPISVQIAVELLVSPHRSPPIPRYLGRQAHGGLAAEGLAVTLARHMLSKRQR